MKKQAKKPVPKKRHRIRKECEECMGEGHVDATCDYCGEDLFTDNVEPGSDSICKKCEREANE